MSRAELENKMAVLLGGRAAEILIFNRDREAPRSFPPPTPPGIRVRTMAVRCG